MMGYTSARGKVALEDGLYEREGELKPDDGFRTRRRTVQTGRRFLNR